MVTTGLKSYVEKYLLQDNKQNQILPVTLVKKSNPYFLRKQFMVPLDKQLKWVNVKQKPFRQI